MSVYTLMQEVTPSIDSKNIEEIHETQRKRAYKE